jgi:hypothetical protein
MYMLEWEVTLQEDVYILAHTIVTHTIYTPLLLGRKFWEKN